MTSSKDDTPDQEAASGGAGGTGGTGGTEGEAPNNELDIEADALLDSLLSDQDDGEPSHDAEQHAKSEPEEDDITGIALPTEPQRQPGHSDLPDEFSDVDELLSSSPPPPGSPTAQPISKSQKATLQGIKAAIPRPGAPGAPRPDNAPPATRKPPAVNPEGPSIREPFLPAMSPKAPPALVARFDDDEEEPTVKEIVTRSARASDPERLRELSLAEQLEPNDPVASEFEDMDEDILESVPPDPIETIVPQASESQPPYPEGALLESEPPRASPPSLPEDEPRETAETVVDDDRTELLDSLPDEALGTYGSERPALEHLAERGVLEEWTARAEWFLREARSMSDPSAKARALLVASEHFALVGQTARAREVASEINATQPSMTMGSRQLRWLAAAEQDYKAVAGALELETRASPTPLARAHAANLAADVHRVWFDDASNARRRLDLAARVLPTDPRPYLFRLAEQLGQSAGPPRLRWPEVPELAALARVAQEAERLRGPVKSAGQPCSTPAVSYEEARRSLANKDITQAIEALVRLGRQRELHRPAFWLAAVLAAPTEATRSRAIELLQELVASEGSDAARQALAARALEQGNEAGVRAALFEGDKPSTAFDSATRLALAALTGERLELRDGEQEHLAQSPMRPLLAAAEAADASLTEELLTLTGEDPQQDELRTGRALAAVLDCGPEAWGTTADAEREDGELAPELERLREACAPLAEVQGRQPLTQILSMEFALLDRNVDLLGAAIAQWPGIESGPSKLLASALTWEVCGNREAAVLQYKRALELDPNHEGATRALLDDASPAQAAELLAKLADNSDDPTQAGFLLLEAALLRTDNPKASEEHLVQAATSAPDLPLVYMQGEQQARQRGDAELLLSWLRQRRENASDSIDKAFDFVREALLVAEADMELAATLLADAVAARPHDIALQELHERLASNSSVERGKWREDVATQLEGDAKQRLLVEAALEYERAGDPVNAARVARNAAAAEGSEFMQLTAERLDMALGNTAQISEPLLKAAREEEDERTQRELYERLSELDELKGDHSSALLWQSAILERSPRYLPALRRLEHEYIGTGRWDDLEGVALELAHELDPSESNARAIWIAQHRILGGKWEAAREPIELACRQEHPSLWALRAFAGQSRGSDDSDASLRVELELMDRARTPLDVATLSLRAAEVATRLGKPEPARALLQRAIQQFPAHLVALTTLADVLDAMGAGQDAAEALEAAATAYQSTKHQVDLWHQAAVLWQDTVHDEERAVHALEAAVERDVTHPEAFRRLQGIYIARRETQKLADLLERRLACTDDPDERVSIEVMRGQALAGVGEKQAAKQALAAALDANPEHAEALLAFADLCMEEGDWTAAEQSFIRLARHEGSPAKQAAIYAKLGALYDNQLPNPTRAELAYQEVLKRDPDNDEALERLVDVQIQLGEEQKAVELQQQLIDRATSDDQRRDRTLDLARVVERVSQDPSRALAILESARKAFGKDSRVLRAHAEFLQRRGEDRAMLVLLDRAAMDARRALSTGRFDTAFFETLATVCELRGAADGAAVAQATLAALRGEGAELSGAGPRAQDPRLDELLAPTALSTPIRMLLSKAGHVLDAAYPVDLRALRAAPLPTEQGALNTHVEQVAEAFGINNIEVFSSPALGPICMPVSSFPARLVYGESLLNNPNQVARYFLLIRALKIIQLQAATLSRTAPIDLWPLMAGLLNIFAANWEPQGADPRKTAQASQRIRAAMTGTLDSDVPVLALEVIGSIGNRASQLGLATNQFGNRTALLAVGDPSAAMQGIALAAGQEKGLPGQENERIRWIVRSSEARDLAVFSVSDAYFQARQALDLQAS